MNRGFIVLSGMALLVAICFSSCGSGTSVKTDVIVFNTDTQSRVDAACTPNCSDKVCGDDGCGGICGVCTNPCTGTPDEGLCVQGQCAEPYCCPECAGLECGDDGCGGSCGECEGNGECVEGACVCEPDCQGRNCGDDGCGSQCGVCSPKEECLNGTCHCAFLQCGDACCFEDEICYEDSCCKATCNGVECGVNKCGESCGDCPETEVCVANECCTPDCSGKECGPDGCGGQCGDCGDLPCEEFLCCVPDCEGKQCGPDGCGFECGQCTGAFENCVDGVCELDPSAVGCSDGTREGFVHVGAYPLLAGCGGAWDIPGIHNEVPACERRAGNDGEQSDGVGCNVTDLCAEEWHVCLGRDDVAYRSPKGCEEAMIDAESPAFFLARTSSTGAFNCAPDTIGSPTSVNDLFGCGDLGCPIDQASCAPLDRGSHDLCKGIRNKPTSTCECYFLGELSPSDASYVEGDFETVKCAPSSGGCGWCLPLDYWNKKLGVTHPDAWECGTNGQQEANNAVKNYPDQQGGVLCCRDQCATDEECGSGEECVMATCQPTT